MPATQPDTSQDLECELAVTSQDLECWLDVRSLAEGLPLLPRLPLHEDRNLATLVGHIRREPEPALPSTSDESLLEGIMKPLRSLPLDPLLLE